MSNKEVLGFQSEVKQLLNLMIHSLYSNKEIFLRELISNASDAADKLRFEALSNPDLYAGDGDLKVQVSVNKEQKTLTISDNGIGMNREEIVKNLGTIARSGTKEFIANLGESSKDSNLIGQFGVGFYSAFIVAEKVEVRSLKAFSEKDEKSVAVLWQSNGDGEYTIEDTTKDSRGTAITLFLKDDELEFLDEYRLRDIITRYSDHIALPVELLVTKTVADDSGDDSEDSEKEQKTKEIQEFEKINKAQALWTRAKNDIKEEEYQEFYKHLSHDYNEALTYTHNKVEGKLDYTSLLYIPAKAPWDLFNREFKHGMKLYVQRVFIMDDAKQFMPNYLRFIKGLIDSNDLPLNVSREILQDNKVTRALRKALTKRSLSLLENLAEDSEKYATFWAEFGLVLKEGLGEDFENKEQIAKLIRFASSKNDSDKQDLSLQQYVENMIEGQKDIYYICADSYLNAKNSPHLEMFKQKGIEVLLLSDRIDEWVLSYLTEFDGKKLQNINQSNLDLGDLSDVDADKKKEQEQQLEGSIERIKNYLGDRVKAVNLTYKLSETPAIVSTDEGEMTTQMAKLLAMTGQKVPAVKYVLEINPDHGLIKKVLAETNDEKFAQWIDVVLEQAILVEKGSLEDPISFTKKLNALLLG